MVWLLANGCTAAQRLTLHHTTESVADVFRFRGYPHGGQMGSGRRPARIDMCVNTPRFSLVLTENDEWPDRARAQVPTAALLYQIPIKGRCKKAKAKRVKVYTKFQPLEARRVTQRCASRLSRETRESGERDRVRECETERDREPPARAGSGSRGARRLVTMREMSQCVVCVRTHGPRHSRI